MEATEILAITKRVLMEQGKTEEEAERLIRGAVAAQGEGLECGEAGAYRSLD